MLVLKAFKFQLKVNKDIASKLSKAAGCSRFIWNKALAMQKESLDKTRKRVGYSQMCTNLKAWKQDTDTSFLKETHSQPLQQTLKNLDRALKDAFNKTNPKRFPRFKKRGRHDSFRYPQGFKILGNRIFLPKIGWVEFRKSREIVGKPKNVTVSRRANHWYVSVQTEIETSQPKHPSTSVVGIDVGVANFAALSTGSIIAPLNSFRKLENNLAKHQRRLAKKKKFSNNWKKQKTKITRLHTRIADARYDFLHKTSTAISKNHAVVVLEDLKVSNMSASAKGTKEQPGKNVRAKAGLNKAILNQGWFEFRRQLEYKQAWLGGQVVLVNPQHTSQTCSTCEHVSPENRRTQSEFCCTSCGHGEHADLNAAKNIRRAGQARIACGDIEHIGIQAQEPPTAACG